MIEFGINGNDRVVLEQGDVYPGPYQTGPTFSGPTSDAGIRIKSIKGKSVQAVSTGKQLFDASRIQDVSRDGVALKNLGNGRFQIEGMLTANYFNHAVTMTHEESMALVKPGKIMSAQNGRTPYAYMTIYKNGVNTGREINTNNRNTCVITEEDLADPTFKISFGFYGRSAFWNPADIYIPMFYQSGDGTWEPFTGGKPGPQPEYPIPIQSFRAYRFGSSAVSDIVYADTQHYLYSLPDGTQDEYKDGKIIRRVGLLTLNGQEPWVKMPMSGKQYAFEYKNLSAIGETTAEELPNLFSSHFKQISAGESWTQLINGITTRKGIIRIKFADQSTIDTVEKFKAWLATNPVEVLYPLAGEQIEAVNLPILPSLAPRTNAWTDSDLDPEITWEALPAGSCALEVQELRKRIEALERKSVEDA
ncbi:hypothetical protein [uncultured Dubosiella sp.]|uniref:hypothetical protein n=1 Tax=uncultured Dubosiella sp. TaxID=1937011 RepID=UPI0032B2DE7A